MSAFIGLYLAWAGPNILAAIASVVLIATLAAFAGISPLTETGLLGSLTGVIAGDTRA